MTRFLWWYAIIPLSRAVAVQQGGNPLLNEIILQAKAVQAQLKLVQRFQQDVVQTQRALLTASNQFNEICQFYIATNNHMDCGCDEKTHTIGCESSLICRDTDTSDNICATIYMYTKYSSSALLKDTEICMEYSPMSDRNNYDNACMLVSSSDGVKIDGCDMAFESGPGGASIRK